MLTFFFTTLYILSTHSSLSLPFTNPHRLLSSTLTSSPDTLVNTYTTDKQYLPASTTLSDGKVLIAWESLNQGANGGGIYSQKFNIDTTPNGVETRLDSSSMEFQTVSTIAALSNSQYIVAYQSTLLAGGTNAGQFAQVYNTDNSAYGSRYRINTYSVISPQTTMTSFSSGKYIIVWKRDGLNSGGYGIYAQIFNSDGTTFGSSTGFKVSTYASGNQAKPAVAELTDGKFVIVWQSSNQDTDSLGIFGQMYNSDGSIYGTEFQVNTYTTNDQSFPKVAGLDSGGFVVTWQSNNQDTSGWGIYAQIYNGGGTRYNSEFQVNTYVLGAQQSPVITALTGGGFVIVWQSDGQDSSGNGVYGQKYNSDGTTFEWEFQVNTYTSGEQSAPIVVSIGNGFVVVWQSAGQDGSDFGIYAKWFTCPSVTPNLYDNQCYLICPSTAQYAYNGACQQACPSTAPYIYNFECYTTCPTEAPNVNSANNCYAEYQQKWANSMNIFTSIALKFFSSINSSSSNYVLIASFSAMLLYIRYLNLDYTSPVMIMFMNQEIINVSFGINAPQSVENGLPNHTLPEEFERYNIYSSFLYNCWDTLMTGLIVLFITFVVMLLTKLTKRWSKVHAVFKMLSTATKWNIPLLVLCGNFNKIIVYACIEMKTLHFDTAGAVMSFLICLLFLGLCLYVVVKILIIARNIMKSQESPGLKRDWKDYTILYEGYKKTSYFTLSYLPIFYLRNLLIDLIITTAYASPRFQTVVMVILSVAMLLYLARYRPLKSVLQMLQLSFNELLLFAVNICVLVLASLNPESDSYATNRDNLGEAIIILNVIFSTANVVFIALESLKWLIVLRKRVKAGKARGLTSFMQILKFVVMPTSGLEHSMSIAKSATIVPSNISSPVIKPEYADSARVQFVKTEQDFASGQTSASKLELLVHKNSSVMMRNLEEARQSFKPLNVSEVSILSKTLVQQEKMDISTINLPEREVEVEVDNKDIKVEDFSWRDVTDNNNNKSFEMNSSVGKEIQLKLGQRVESEVFEYTSRKRRRHAKSDVSEPAEDNRMDNRIRRSSLGYYI